MRIVFRRACGFLSIATLMVGLILPPTHVHLDEPDEGHHHPVSVVHAHWQGHASAHSERSLTDPEGRLLFLDQAATSVDSDDYLVHAVPVAVLTDPGATPVLTRLRAPRSGTGGSRDGPPLRRSSSRAPPLVA
jgi:hypothetical protein